MQAATIKTIPFIRVISHLISHPSFTVFFETPVALILLGYLQSLLESYKIRRHDVNQHFVYKKS